MSWYERCIDYMERRGKEKITEALHYHVLKEAFYIFKEEHPDYKIGLSKFCSLRPKMYCY